MVGFLDVTKELRIHTDVSSKQTRRGEEPFFDNFFDNG